MWSGLNMFYKIGAANPQSSWMASVVWDVKRFSRGASFSQKLALLESELNRHGTELEEFFNLVPIGDGRGYKYRTSRRMPDSPRSPRGKLSIPTLLALKKGPQEAAEWRQRVHDARRRVIIVVRVAVMLMRGKLRSAPVPRLDRFDFAIYATLGTDWTRVADEQQRCMTLRDQVEAAAVALQDEMHAATAAQLEAPAPTGSALSPLSVAPAGSPVSSVPEHSAAQPLLGGKGDADKTKSGPSVSAAAAARKSPHRRTFGPEGGEAFRVMSGGGGNGGSTVPAAQSPPLHGPPMTAPSRLGPRDHIVPAFRSGIGSTTALHVVRTAPSSPLSSPLPPPPAQQAAGATAAAAVVVTETDLWGQEELAQLPRSLSPVRESADYAEAMASEADGRSAGPSPTALEHTSSRRHIRRVSRSEADAVSGSIGPSSVEPRSASFSGVLSSSRAVSAVSGLTRGTAPTSVFATAPPSPMPRTLATPGAPDPFAGRWGSGLFICARVRKPLPPPLELSALGEGPAGAATSAPPSNSPVAGALQLPFPQRERSASPLPYPRPLTPSEPGALRPLRTASTTSCVSAADSIGLGINSSGIISLGHSDRASNNPGLATVAACTAHDSSSSRADGVSPVGDRRSSGQMKEDGPMGRRSLVAISRSPSPLPIGGGLRPMPPPWEPPGAARGGGGRRSSGSVGNTGERCSSSSVAGCEGSGAAAAATAAADGRRRSSGTVGSPCGRLKSENTGDGVGVAGGVDGGGDGGRRHSITNLAGTDIGAETSTRTARSSSIGTGIIIRTNPGAASRIHVDPDSVDSGGAGLPKLGASRRRAGRLAPLRRDPATQDPVSSDHPNKLTIVQPPGRNGVDRVSLDGAGAIPPVVRPRRVSSEGEQKQPTHGSPLALASPRVAGLRSRLRASYDGQGSRRTEWQGAFSCPSSPLKHSSPAEGLRGSSGAGHASSTSPLSSPRPTPTSPRRRHPAGASSNPTAPSSPRSAAGGLRPPLPSPPPTASGPSPRSLTDAPISSVSKAVQAIRQATAFVEKAQEDAAAAAAAAAAPSASPPPLLLGAPPARPPPPPPPMPVPEETLAKINQMKAQCQSKLEELQRCSQLITMLLNRCNAGWAEAQSWGPANSVTQLQLSAFARSESAIVFRNELLRLLRCGGVAVHLRAADDFLEPGMTRTASAAAATVTSGGAGGSGVSPAGGASVSTSVSPSLEQTVSKFERSDAGPDIAASGETGNGGGGGPAAPASAMAGGAGLGPTAPGTLYRSTAPDLWTQDPWRLLETYRPGMVVPGAFRLEGVPLGCRYIAGLVMELEALAGPDAVARLPLVLVVSEDQQDEVVDQLWHYQFFGIPRENVLVLVQPSHPGYSYDSTKRTWDQGDASHSLPLGSGYGLMQLAWREEAMGVGEDGCLVPLNESALTWMEARGVTWMISRRARDLGLLSSDGVLDVNTLAYGLYYHTDRSPGTNIVMEASASSSLLLSRVLDSVIMSRRLDGAAAAAAAAAASAAAASAGPTFGGAGAGGSTPYAVGSPSAYRKQSVPPLPVPDLSAASRSAGPQHQVVELCHTDLSTPAMRAVLTDYQAGGRVLTGLGRYMMHLPSIAPMLAGRLSVLRPKLGLVDDLLHIRMELADLTSAPNASSLLVQARPDTPQLVVQDDVEALLPLLQAQDSNTYFRRLVLSSRHDERRASVSSVVGASGGHTTPRAAPGQRRNPKAQHILVYVVSNVVSSAAVAMASTVAQPGRDTVTLACVVSEGQGVLRQRAEELLAKHAAEFHKLCGAHYNCEIVDRGSLGLIDCMDEYATRLGATLVILGSNSLTRKATTMSFAGSASSTSAASLLHIIGSITLALLRRLPMPLLLVTRASSGSNSATAAPPPPSTSGRTTGGGGGGGAGRRKPMRVMAVLEGAVTDMVDYVAARLCNARGGDQLYLTYIKPSPSLTQQQMSTIKALVGRYVHSATTHNMRPTKTLILDGPADRTLASAVAEHSCDLLALPAAPVGRQLPPAVVATMRAACTAVLWYRNHTPVDIFD